MKFSDEDSWLEGSGLLLLHRRTKASTGRPCPPEVSEHTGGGGDKEAVEQRHTMAS